MKRKCSFCKEAGHDKRQCPIEREKIQEEITFKRERLNLFLERAPDLLANPVFMGLLWFWISRNNPLLRTANTLMIAGDIGGLNIPESASLGAVIQKAESAPEYLEQVKTGFEAFYEKHDRSLISDLFGWITKEFEEFEEGLEYKPQL